MIKSCNFCPKRSHNRVIAVQNVVISLCWKGTIFVLLEMTRSNLKKIERRRLTSIVNFSTLFIIILINLSFILNIFSYKFPYLNYRIII